MGQSCAKPQGRQRSLTNLALEPKEPPFEEEVEEVVVHNKIEEKPDLNAPEEAKSLPNTNLNEIFQGNASDNSIFNVPQAGTSERSQNSLPIPVSESSSSEKRYRDFELSVKSRLKKKTSVTNSTVFSGPQSLSPKVIKRAQDKLITKETIQERFHLFCLVATEWLEFDDEIDWEGIDREEVEQELKRKKEISIRKRENPNSFKEEKPKGFIDKIHETNDNDPPPILEVGFTVDKRRLMKSFLMVRFREEDMKQLMFTGLVQYLKEVIILLNMYYPENAPSIGVQVVLMTLLSIRALKNSDIFQVTPDRMLHLFPLLLGLHHKVLLDSELAPDEYLEVFHIKDKESSLFQYHFTNDFSKYVTSIEVEQELVELIDILAKMQNKERELIYS